MNYVIKTKLIRPSPELLNSLEMNSNIARFTYNWLLGYCLKNKTTPKKARDELRKQIKSKSVINQKDDTIYDKEFQEVIKGTPSQITDMEADNLIRAFKTVKEGEVPKFKSRIHSRRSFTLNKKDKSNFKLDGDLLSIVKVGTIKIDTENLRFDLSKYDIQRVTLSKSAYGWYASILIRIPDDTFRLSKSTKKVGIDWGVRAFASDSDREQFRIEDSECYNGYEKLEKKLKRLQAILSRKREANTEWKTSHKYQILKDKIAHTYERLANKRKDFLHEVSKYYVENYDIINIEKLRPKNMMKNHRIARSISESMYYTWKVMISYKCEWYGRTLNFINPTNTSQTCSKCGKVLEDKLEQSDLVFICPCCGHKDDRDLNAAVNILNAA